MIGEESQQDRFVRNRSRISVIIAILFAVFCVVVIIGVIAFNIYKIGKTEVHVMYAPFSAKVTLGDRTLHNNATNYIVPGKYTIKVEFENFETLTAEIEIKDDTERIFDMLKPANDEGKKYLNDHIKDFQMIESLYGAQTAEYGKAEREALPIMSKLPIKDPHYTIGYYISEDNHLTINVYSSIAYRALAISKVLDITDDSDLGKYDVEIKDLINPYTNPVSNTEVDPTSYIRKAFPNYSFEVGTGKYVEGYYVTYLSGWRDNVPEIFRVALAREGNTWRLVGNPYPILTSANTPNVPMEVINTANKL